MRIKKIFEVKQSYSELTKSEKVVFDFLSNHYDEIGTFSATYIAKRCYCSATTVYRVVSKLGYTTYREFRYQVVAEQEVEDTLYSLANINGNFGYEHLNEIVKEIIDSDIVYIICLDSLDDVGLYLQKQLMYVGITSIVVSKVINLRNYNKKLLFFISDNGEDKEIINMAIWARYNQLRVVTMTRKNSILSNIVQYSYTHLIETEKLTSLQKYQHIYLLIMINVLVEKLERDYK